MRDGWPDDVLSADDLYPDAVPCLTELRARGYRIGIAGNQPAGAEQILAACGIPADIVASSESWGVEKPSPEFFARLIRKAGAAPSEVAYVGDHLDHDVIPAHAARPRDRIHPPRPVGRDPRDQIRGRDRVSPRP